MKMHLHVVKKENESSWVNYIHRRIELNKNMLMFISGPTGSGKSYASLSIAQQLDDEFSSERIVFNPLELMQLINSGKLKKGSAIVFEEVGVSFSNRNWQSKINKVLNYLIQTFRHRNFILIMNAPYIDFIDSSMRKLFHGELRTMEIDKKTNKTILKPLLIQYNSRNAKFYYKFLRIKTPEGIKPIRKWGVVAPDEELLTQYEIKKEKFTTELNLEIYNELNKDNPAEKSKQSAEKRLKCPKCAYEWEQRGDKRSKKCPECSERLKKYLPEQLYMRNNIESAIPSRV